MVLGQNVKNYFINGRFDFWQRGTSFALNTAVYTSDRWSLALAADGGTLATGTVARQSVTDVNYLEQPFFARINNTTTGTSLGTSSYATIFQRVEDVRNLAGKTVTISIWASSTISGKQIAVYALQGFGSGGSALNFINCGATATIKTLTTSITRYDFTINVPSVSGKTIGTGSYLEIGFFLQGGSTLLSSYGYGSAIAWGNTGNTDIYRIMASEGSATLDFEMAGRNLAQELAFCQRYFFGLTDTPTNVAAGTFESNVLVARISFPVVMRVIPTVTFANTTIARPQITQYALQSVTSTTSGTVTFNNNTIGTTPAREAGYIFVNAGGFLFFDAEI